MDGFSKFDKKKKDSVKIYLEWTEEIESGVFADHLTVLNRYEELCRYTGSLERQNYSYSE